MAPANGFRRVAPAFGGRRLDALHSIAFYVFAAAAVLAALVLLLPQTRVYSTFAAPLFVLAVAALLADLSAGFAALVALVALGAGAMICLRRESDVVLPEAAAARLVQAAGAGAALVFLLLAYVGFRADFHAGAYPGGAFGSAALGRLLFEHDVVAVDAVGAAALSCLLAIAGGRRAAVRPTTARRR